ncbi:MAG TPA: DUF2130 domain-containing protein [Methylomirabilota bacterium]|nr:DUF2130 domain-containing protein [Methylomirabilota bacterium]
MAEPTVFCPQCKAEIKLTESLAAPLLESVRRDYEQRLLQKDADVAKREQALKERAEALEKAKAALDQQVEQKLQQERARIAAEEAKKAKLALSHDIEQKSKEIGVLQEILKERDAKLAEAQKAQAEMIRRQRELDDAKRELELTIEKRVQADLAAEREKARKEAEEELKLKVLEKDQTITAMQKQIEDLKRRAEQGSQQLQGEVQEIQLESLLAAKFPRDTIQPVPKGEFGGDVLQRVVGPLNQPCGTILWECKRTKNWSDGWLPKLREDQRAAKAEIAVIVSQALPKDIESFGFVDGVWVVDPKLTLPVAFSLRQTLVEVATARQATEGQQTKMEMVYQYLTGPRFRQRVQAIVEAFSSMREDLDREKKAITRQWAKREEQIDRVMLATVGMYGDLQGIAGKTLQEIEGLDFQGMLEAPADEREADPQEALFKMK